MKVKVKWQRKGGTNLQSITQSTGKVKHYIIGITLFPCCPGESLWLSERQNTLLGIQTHRLFNHFLNLCSYLLVLLNFITEVSALMILVFRYPLVCLFSFCTLNRSLFISILVFPSVSLVLVNYAMDFSWNSHWSLPSIRLERSYGCEFYSLHRVIVCFSKFLNFYL